MVDIKGRDARSENMRRIRPKDTRPELFVRKYLHSIGFRYRLHKVDLPGVPDLVLPKYKAVVMVHGCFWHHHQGCKYAYIPKTRTEFWVGKFERNILRDHEVQVQLLNLGWRTATVWECALRNADLRLASLAELATWLRGEGDRIRIPAVSYSSSP